MTFKTTSIATTTSKSDRPAVNFDDLKTGGDFG